MKGDPGCGITVRDTFDLHRVRVSLGGGAWGEAVDLQTPSKMAYYTLSPEGAEDLAEALVSLAAEARINREKQRAEYNRAIDAHLRKLKAKTAGKEP